MTNCTKCNSYTETFNGLCEDCYNQEVQRKDYEEYQRKEYEKDQREEYEKSKRSEDE